MKCSVLVAAFLRALAMHMVDAMILKQPASDSLVPAMFNSSKTSGFLKVPTGQRIALILRGETFRLNYWDAKLVKHRTSCAKESADSQMKTIQSILENVIQPFERSGNHVEILFTSVDPFRGRFPSLIERSNNSVVSSEDADVFETTFDKCGLDDMIITALQAPHRPVTNGGRVVSWGQAGTMLQVKALFEKIYGGVEGVSSKFHQIIILRNDLYWYKPLDQIRASFDNINFLAGCGNGCIHDTAFFVPGKLYAAVDACFGKVRSCFNRRDDPNGNGHGCYLFCLKDKLPEFGHANKVGFFEAVDRRVRGVDSTGQLSQHVADLLRARSTEVPEIWEERANYTVTVARSN